jgi:hypothetical protein
MPATMTTMTLSLLPTPRQISFTPGSYRLEAGQLILISGENLQALRFTAKRFQQALTKQHAFSWEAEASESIPSSLIGLAIRLSPERVQERQGYRLSITPERIEIDAHEEAGAFYAVCTLIQILEQSAESLPCLQISDEPDFPVRGVMLDISRDKVPTMDTLFALVDLLAGWKINQLQLYTEHTFAYRQHPEVWAKASPLTGQEILDLDAFCRKRYIELVPNQNSFGHMNRWLSHARYAPLSEVQNGYLAPWGPMKGSFSLCPTDPESFTLLSGLYDELLPHFSSRMVNVGCDETFDIGQGRSQEACASRGKGRVYLDFLLKIYQDIASRGLTMQFWGDIVLQHPELIPDLPKDFIALDWGYEADHPFDQEAARFESAGLPFYVCPGTSAWCSVAGRSDNALGNLLSAAENGLKHGAGGYLITDWGDNGHWQMLPVSFLGFAAGAAYSWALAANRSLDIPQALSQHAFHDQAGVLGCAAYKLGNIYQSCSIDWLHSSPLFWILQNSLEQIRAKEKIHAIPFRRVLEIINEIDFSTTYAKITAGQDTHNLIQAELVLKEFELTARLLRHACWRGILATEGLNTSPIQRDLDLDMQSFIEEYQGVWLKRNRPGGLPDSVARLEKTRMDYRALILTKPF